jgi:hypothetical protein
MGYVPKNILSADASPGGWPEKGRHIGGQKAECTFRTGNTGQGDFFLHPPTWPAARPTGRYT